MSTEQFEQQVNFYLTQLHKGENVQASNEWLTKFQQQSAAWETSNAILSKPNTPTPTLHFAAQTLAVKAQTGLSGVATPPAACKDGVIQLIQALHAGPTIVVRQLVLALCGIVLHTTEWQDPIVDVTNALSAQHLHPVLLEFLALLPEEQKNDRVLIEPRRRATFGHALVQKTEFVMNTLATILQTANGSLQMEVKILRAFQSWLTGQWAVLSDPGTHPIISTLPNLPLFKLCMERLPTVDVNMCKVCGECVSEIFSLSETLNEKSEPAIIAIVESMLSLMAALQKHQGSSSDKEDCCKVLCRLLGEIAENHFHHFVYADSAVSQSVVQRVVEMALTLLGTRNTEIAESVLDFWYNLLSHHLCTQEQANLENLSQPGESIYQRQARINESQQRRQVQRQYLVPLYKRMVEVLTVAVRYPADVDDLFELDEFSRVRELFSISLTEACVVVGPEWVLDLVGAQLTATANSGSFKWHEVEGNLFVLTSIAPRARAGADAVIPQMLAVLPELPYPEAGYPALLFRCAVGRLIHFTSGYLGTNLEKCLPLFSLFTDKLVPETAAIQVPSKETKAQCEGQVISGLLVMVHEAAANFVKENAHLKVLTALGNLIMNQAISVEGRCNVVMAAGSVISALPAEQMYTCLKQLISPLGDTVKNALSQNVDPKQLAKPTKLFFVALQSVRPTTPVPPEVKHPVVECLSENWTFVEQAVSACYASETIMQDACHSLTNILHLARTHTSVVVVPFLRLIVNCFQRMPMIFHLGASRTVMGVFGSTKDEAMLKTLSEAMKVLGEATLARMQDKEFIINLPDITGMYYDALAGALQPPPLAHVILHSDWISSCLVGAVDTLPNCQHQKAMCAMLLFITRLVFWVNRPQVQSGEFATIMAQASAKARELLLQFLAATLRTLIACLANTAKGVQHATPLIASCLQPLFTIPEAPEALRTTLQALGNQYMADSFKETFYNTVTTQKDPRLFAEFCQETAEHCVAQWKKATHG